MPSKQSIELQRYKSYYGNVEFYIRHWTTYSDGTKTETETEKFSGKERHLAIKRFKELQKQFPGIEAKSNIWPQREKPDDYIVVYFSFAVFTNHRFYLPSWASLTAVQSFLSAPGISAHLNVKCA